MLLLLSGITVALIVYVLRVKDFTPTRAVFASFIGVPASMDNALRLCVSFMTLALAIYNVYLFVYDALHARYAHAAIDALCFGTNIFIFRVFWSGLGVRLFREKAGVLAPERVWVFMIDSFMYLSPSFTGLAKQVVTEWCDDKHLVG